MSNETSLSVVILCYRSGPAIVRFVEQVENHVKESTPNYELVLVANYIEESNDTTREHVLKIAEANPKCKVLCKPKQGMMGWDMRLGMDAATGAYICVIDGDGQFPIESIAACYAEIITGKYDLVKTYRIKRGDGVYRKTISWVYNMFFRILFPGINFKDANSKPKILTREAYQKMDLKSDDWFIDAEIMLNVRDQHMRFYELPVEFFELEGRTSFVKPSAILEFIKNLVRHRLRR